MIHYLHIIIGLVLLTLGQRLFWLFVGCMGFVAGLQMAQLYLVGEAVWIVWAVALLFGLAGALIALFFQTLAIGLGGFAAGSIFGAYLADLIGLPMLPVIALIGGIAGVVLLYLAFDWALIGLSSVVGSSLIVQSLGLTGQIEMAVYTVLIAVGIAFQTALLLSRGHDRK